MSVGPDIPPEHADIHAKLENWGRWCRSRPHLGHVASLEGRYRAPRGAEAEWETATPPPSPLPPPNDPDALAIELIWRFIPKRQRFALRMVHVFRAEQAESAKRSHVNYKEWPEFIYLARCSVINLLTRHNKRFITAQIRERRAG